METDELPVVCRRNSHHVGCHVCANVPEMIAPEEAAALVGVNMRVIIRSIETGRLHFTETREAAVVVCPRSIAECGLWKAD